MVPSYLSDTLDLPVEQASMAASAFPFGSLISVLVGGFVFDKLNRNTMAWMMGGLLLLASACLGTFLAHAPMEHDAAIFDLLVALAAVSVRPLHLAPAITFRWSVFSIEFGGPSFRSPHFATRCTRFRSDGSLLLLRRRDCRPQLEQLSIRSVGDLVVVVCYDILLHEGRSNETTSNNNGIEDWTTSS